VGGGGGGGGDERRLLMRRVLIQIERKKVRGEGCSIGGSIGVGKKKIYSGGVMVP